MVQEFVCGGCGGCKTIIKFSLVQAEQFKSCNELQSVYILNYLEKVTNNKIQQLEENNPSLKGGKYVLL